MISPSSLYRPSHGGHPRLPRLIPVRPLVRAEFTALMEMELRHNDHKRDWRLWRPSAIEALNELSHHQSKVIQAIADGKPGEVAEYTADIANIAMKIEECFGADQLPAGMNHFCPGESGRGEWCHRSTDVHSVCGYCGEANAVPHQV